MALCAVQHDDVFAVHEDPDALILQKMPGHVRLHGGFVPAGTGTRPCS